MRGIVSSHTRIFLTRRGFRHRPSAVANCGCFQQKTPTNYSFSAVEGRRSASPSALGRRLPLRTAEIRRSHLRVQFRKQPAECAHTQSSRSTVDVLRSFCRLHPQPSVQIIPRVPLQTSRPGNGSIVDGLTQFTPRRARHLLQLESCGSSRDLRSIEPADRQHYRRRLRRNRATGT